MRVRGYATAVPEVDMRYVPDQPELPHYEKKNLPQGTWISFRNLAAATTEQDISDVIASRTGVVLGVERIQLSAYRHGIIGAIVSLGKDDVTNMLAWALTDDTLHDRPIEIGKMNNAAW